LYAIPTWSRTATLIAEHPTLQEVLRAAPSVYALYRFATKLRRNKPVLEACLNRTATALRAERPEYGLDVAIDASDMPAFANGQRYLSKNGPERERYSDPDASWGHRSAVSTRKGGGFYGYKLHAAVCARTDLPMAMGGLDRSSKRVKFGGRSAHPNPPARVRSRDRRARQRLRPPL